MQEQRLRRGIGIGVGGADTDQGCDFDYMAGLFSASDRDAVVRAMEDGLRAADQAVTGSYLRTLSTLSVYLQHPEFRPAQTRETKGRLVAGGELSRRSDLVDAARSVYGDILTAAMQGKADRARAITLAEVQALAQRQPSATSPAELAYSRAVERPNASTRWSKMRFVRRSEPVEVG